MTRPRSLVQETVVCRMQKENKTSVCEQLTTYSQAKLSVPGDWICISNTFGIRKQSPSSSILFKRQDLPARALYCTSLSKRTSSVYPLNTGTVYGQLYKLLALGYRGGTGKLGVHLRTQKQARLKKDLNLTEDLTGFLCSSLSAGLHSYPF